jgi:hypothetical protein
LDQIVGSGRRLFVTACPLGYAFVAAHHVLDQVTNRPLRARRGRRELVGRDIGEDAGKNVLSTLMSR